MVKYFSMFTGSAGFEEGIRKAHPDWQCVGFSEIDKFCNELLAKKYSEVENYGDATKIKEHELPEFDMLVGGFPCQSFSIAGKRKGFSDTRGTLFFDIARIIKVKRPKIVWLENVKGLLNHEKGKTFTVILQTLDELGYDVQWQVLNSKHFGVPQNRERVFIIASLRGQPRPKVFPIRQDAGKIQEIFGKEIVSPTITTENTHSYGKTVTCGQTKAIAMVSNCAPREAQFRTICPTLAARDYKDPKIVYKMHRANEIREYSGISLCLTESHQHKGGSNTPIVPCLTKNIGNNVPLLLDAGLVRRGEWGDGIHTKTTGTLNSSSGRDFLVNGLRRLTPVECERLQGFPDGWTEGFSDTQRYKMMGNAVTVNVIEAIARKIK